MAEENRLNFTYWLGAGASANALPTVSNFQIALLSYFENFNDQERASMGGSLTKVRDEFIWLGKQIAAHISPDTFAKIAHLKGDNATYNRVKNVLTVFFFLEETRLFNRTSKIDSRYLNLIASCCKSLPVFPENLKILSWNYDSQLELAASMVRQDQFTPTLHRRTLPLIEYYPSTALNNFHINYQLIHLNGCATIHNSGNLEVWCLHNSDKADSLEAALNTLLQITENPFIRFAWEQYQPEKLIADHLRTTDILVIIGYSFPFFNRDTDKRIFDFFKEGKRLRKIYFQNSSLNGDFLYNQFGLTNKLDSSLLRDSGPRQIRYYVEIEHISNCNYFFIPNEF
jgi:hypothetical protein